MKNFASKIELFLFIKSSISQDIVLTGSTALGLLGFAVKQDPYDLDIVICNPNENTNKQLELLKMVYPEPPKPDTIPEVNTTDGGKSVAGAAVQKPEEEYSDEVNEKNQILGRRIFLLVKQQDSENQYKVHIFIKDEAQPLLTIDIDGIPCKISRPSDIFLAKRTQSRKKDWKQLAEVCSLVLGV